MQILDYSEAEVELRKLNNELSNSLKNKNYVKSMEVIVEIRAQTSMLKTWLIDELSKEK